jgi:hypothetical protein
MFSFLFQPFSFNEINFAEKTVPEYNYNPVVYKIFADHTLPMQIPGMPLS